MPSRANILGRAKTTHMYKYTHAHTINKQKQSWQLLASEEGDKKGEEWEAEINSRSHTSGG